MAMTLNDFRRIALSMEGACEASHMGHPDFRVAGRIFATIWPKQKWGMVKLAPDAQQEFVRLHPAVFQPVNGGWGRKGCTHVYLENAEPGTVRSAMTAAWQTTVSKSKPKRGLPRKRSAGKRS
jgi:hypothetical protein